MRRDLTNREYFLWIYRLICYDGLRKRSNYKKLLNYLHSVKFEYTIPMDGNRAEDGVYLRYRFGYERKHNDTVIANLIDNSDCSVFEMLAALAIRCEEHIMNNPDIGNRTGKWFWCMINNLGLSDMNDENFDEAYTEMVIDRFLDHEYKRNGEGGLFVLECPPRDLRYVEIWHQAMWFLDEYLENREE